MSHVTVEGPAAITGNSGHKAVAPADVCLTPVGAGVVPVPYVNVAPASHLRRGSDSVRFGGAPVMLNGSQLSPSTGNEAGTLGGVRSKVIRGAADTLQTSMFVRVEGAHVVRCGDLVFQNSKNTLGTLR